MDWNRSSRWIVCSSVRRASQRKQCLFRGVFRGVGWTLNCPTSHPFVGFQQLGAALHPHYFHCTRPEKIKQNAPPAGITKAFRNDLQSAPTQATMSNLSYSKFSLAHNKHLSTYCPPQEKKALLHIQANLFKKRWELRWVLVKWETVTTPHSMRTIIKNTMQ